MSNRIHELDELIKELRSEKIFKATHLSVLMDNYLNNRNRENIDKMEELRSEINEIDSKLNPLIQEYEQLHHHYFVIFTTEMPDVYGKNISKHTFQSNMRSTIDCDIDTTVQEFDLNIYNLRELVEDLGQKLLHTYTNVRFDRITKIN
jgi:archaellum component FlaC